MQGANQYGILYVVSPTKLVLLPVGDDPVLNVFSSGATTRGGLRMIMCGQSGASAPLLPSPV